MPTIKPVPKHDPTDAEWPAFVAWATSRPSFRPDAALGAIPGLGGAVVLGKHPQTLAELVERWRSLGRPVPSPGRRPRLSVTS